MQLGKKFSDASCQAPEVESSSGEVKKCMHIVYCIMSEAWVRLLLLFSAIGRDPIHTALAAIKANFLLMKVSALQSASILLAFSC